MNVKCGKKASNSIDAAAIILVYNWNNGFAWMGYKRSLHSWLPCVFRFILFFALQNTSLVRRDYHEA
jgi:hypothetical protein